MEQSSVSSQPSARPKRQIGELLFCLLVLGVIGAAGLYAILESRHAPRIIGGLLPLAVGLLLVFLVARRRRWMARLCWAVGILALSLGMAALAWWFVPTADGISLWASPEEAERLVMELRALPPADFNGYQENQAASYRLAQAFPAFQGRLEEAQQAWLQRTADHRMKQMDELPATGFDIYINGREVHQQLINLGSAQLAAQVQRAEQNWAARTADRQVAELQALLPGDLAGLKAGCPARVQLAQLFPEHRTRLHEAERAWGERTAAAAVAKADELLKTDPAAASAQLRQTAQDLAALGENAAAQKQLLAGRKRALAACLDDARRQTRALVKENRFQAAAQAAKGLEETLGGEAAAVGLGPELSNFHASCQFLAALARSAGKPDPD
jgi:hypothetical protein